MQVATDTFRLPLPLLVEIETGSIEAGAVLELKFRILNPDGFQVHEQGQLVTVPEGLIRRTRVAVALELSGSLAGLWRVQVLAGGQVIGEFPIEIRTSSTRTTTAAAT
jgi:hypothetical protein